MTEIGLMLGSFDPPHIGHAYAAIKALEQVDAVWFITAWQNPWKKKSSPYLFRHNMVELMVQDLGDKRIISLDMEYMIQPKYTYQLIKYLYEYVMSDVQYTIIGGTDIMNEISKWDESEYILDTCKTFKVDRSKIDISSTEIREKLKNNETAMPFLTPSVNKFILKNNIYDAINT